MPRASDLSSFTAEDLRLELRSRDKRVKRLLATRQRLSEQLNAVNEEIRGLGASPTARERAGSSRKAGRGGRSRPRNAMTLADALAALLKGQTMSVTDAAEAVQKAGYKTTSENFRTMVNLTLLKDGRFRRVSRGKYTAR